MKIEERLANYMYAGFPILYLNTFEEKLAIDLLQKVAKRVEYDKLIQW